MSSGRTSRDIGKRRPRRSVLGLKQATSAVCRAIVGGALVWSCASKLVYPDRFVDHVLAFSVTGLVVSQWVAVFLPVLELVLGMALLLRIASRGAFILSSGLLAFFIFLQSWALIYGKAVPCGCFSVGLDQAPINWLSWLRTVGLFIASIIGLWMSLPLRGSTAATAEDKAAQRPVSAAIGST